MVYRNPCIQFVILLYPMPRRHQELLGEPTGTMMPLYMYSIFLTRGNLAMNEALVTFVDGGGI